MHPSKNGNPGSELARDVYKDQCVRLKIQGKTYTEISAELGISRSYACTLVHASHGEVNARRVDDHDQWVEHEWATSDMLMDELMPDCLDGEHKNFPMIMKLLDYRAKLRGLYAPTKLDMRGSTGNHPALSPEDMRDNIKKRLAEFAERKKLEAPNGHTNNGGNGNGTSQP